MLMSFDLNAALEAQGKALGAHPAFMDRSTQTSTYSPGRLKSHQGAISQREAARHEDAYGGRQAIDWVYDCIGLYSDPAGASDWRLEKDDGTKLVRKKLKGTPPDNELGPSELYDLLDRPNPFMRYYELMSLLVIDLLLVGNAYWLKWQAGATGKPLALYRLCPSHVKIIPGPYGPVQYEYQPPGVTDKLVIDPSGLIHFRRPNPHSAYYGMGVIQGAGRSMDLELAITNTMASFYENNADPSLIIQSERRVPRDVFNKLRAQLRGRVAGSDKSGELLVLESGLVASTLSRSAQDAMFAELSTMSRDRVLMKFRASAALLGDVNALGAAAKIADVRREFDNSALRPFLHRLSVEISDALASLYDVKYIIDHRSSLPPDEAIKVAAEIAKAPGIKVREVRLQYAQFGVEESTGDENIDNFVLNLPGPQMDANGQIIDPVTGKKVSGQGSADRPLAGEPGRPPKGENTSGFGVAGVKSLDSLLLELEAKAMNAAGERMTIGNKLPDEKRPQDRLARERALDVTAAQRVIEAGLRDAATQLERDLLDHVEGKALKTSDIVSRIRNSPAWRTFRAKVAATLHDGVTRAAASGALHSGLTPDEEVNYDEIADSIINRKEGLNSITTTLKNRVATKIKEARDANAERHDFEAAVREVISEWSSRQASLIAETEAVHGYNEATLVSAELSGLTEVFVTDGDDHDQPCVDANESVWSIEHARENRLEHPRCRRAFLPIS